MCVSMHSRIKATLLAGCACLSLCMLGCNRPALTTIPVEGRVTWKGQPVPNGKIAFHPKQLAEGGVNRMGIGSLDADGNYKLSTVTHGDGVQPGEYSVVIISRGDGNRSLDPGEPGDRSNVSNIPVVYTSITTTPLKATIAADAPSPVKVDFDLKE